MKKVEDILQKNWDKNKLHQAESEIPKRRQAEQIGLEKKNTKIETYQRKCNLSQEPEAWQEKSAHILLKFL